MESKSVGEDFITRFYANNVQCNIHGRAAGIRSNGMLDTHVFGEIPFEVCSDGLFFLLGLVSIHNTSVHC